MYRGIHKLLFLSHEGFGEWLKKDVNAALECVERDVEQKQTYCNEGLILIAIVNCHKYFYV